MLARAAGTFCRTLALAVRPDRTQVARDRGGLAAGRRVLTNSREYLAVETRWVRRRNVRDDPAEPAEVPHQEGPGPAPGLKAEIADFIRVRPAWSSPWRSCWAPRFRPVHVPRLRDPGRYGQAGRRLQGTGQTREADDLLDVAELGDEGGGGEPQFAGEQHPFVCEMARRLRRRLAPRLMARRARGIQQRTSKPGHLWRRHWPLRPEGPIGITWVPAAARAPVPRPPSGAG